MAEIEVLLLLVLNAALLVYVASRITRASGAAGDERLETELRNVRERIDTVNTTSQVLAERSGAIPRLEDSLKSIQAGVAALPGVASKVDDLHSTFTDTTMKGRLGEAAVENILARLPTDLWERQYPLGGGIVDFVVQMPNGLLLPIDAKMSGSEVVREFIGSSESSFDPDTAIAEAAAERARELSREVGARLYQQAERIRKYAKDASGVVPVVLEAVPGPLFDAVDHSTKSDCSKLGVEIVSYEMLLPLVSVLRSQNSHDVDSIRRAAGNVLRFRASLEKVDDILVNKVGKARTMLTNAQVEIEAELNNVRSALAGMEG